MSTERPDKMAAELMDPSGFFADNVVSQLSGLTALDATYVAQKCSADVGFDFVNIDLVINKVREEIREMLEAFDLRGKDPEHYAEELGDCFFALVNLCRHSGLDPEELVRANTRKYLARCQYVEEALKSSRESWKD